MNKKFLEFPKEFLWGAVTSAHQIEGDNFNSDWWQWEQKGGGREPSGIACDSYHRFEEDFKIAKKLNHKAHRLSIEWARIEPEEGKFSGKEIAHYREVLKSLKDKNIKTFVTLWHFTNPLWFSKSGGWERFDSPKIFLRYVDFCEKNLGDLVDFWVTVNEPTVYVGQSYIRGLWPPQKRSFLSAAKVFINIARAHRASYKVLSKLHPRVGFAHNIIRFDCDSKNPLDRTISFLLNRFSADSFLLLCKGTFDFLGVNYYLQYKVKNLKLHFDFTLGKTEYMNWPICPEGLYKVLKDLRKYKKTIYITENGCSDSKDKFREFFIREHLKAVHRAISEGVDVRGYLYWSLIDNFEWHLGFDPRFGLVEINRENNLERKIRPSAWYYAKVAKENRIEL